MSNIGFREIVNVSALGLKQLNDTLRALWSKVMGGIDYQDLNGAVRGAIESKASASALDALGTRVGQAESALTQQADLISAKVSATDLTSALSGYSTLEQTSSGIATAVGAAVGDIQTALSTVEQSVDGVTTTVQEMDTRYSCVTQEIGLWKATVRDGAAQSGTNYAVNGAPDGTDAGWSSISAYGCETVTDADAPSGHAVRQWMRPDNPGATIAGCFASHKALTAGATYTVSLWAKLVSSAYAANDMLVRAGRNEAHVCALTGAWQRFKWTFTAQAASSSLVIDYRVSGAETNPGVTMGAFDMHSLVVEAGDTLDTIAWSEYIDAEDNTSRVEATVTRAGGLTMTGMEGGEALAVYTRVAPEEISLRDAATDAALARVRMRDGLPCVETDTGDVRAARVIAGSLSATDTALSGANGVASGGTFTATLTTAGWASLAQNVAVTGLRENATVLVSPTPASRADYAAAGIYCSAQAAGSLTFTCADAPTADISVNILALGGMSA